MFFQPVYRPAIMAVVLSLMLICGVVHAQSVNWTTLTMDTVSTDLSGSDGKTTRGTWNQISAAFANSYSNGVYYNQWKMFYQTPLKMGPATFLNACMRGEYNDFGNSSQPYGSVTALAQFGADMLQHIHNGYYLTSYAGFGGTRREGKWYGGGQASLGVLNQIGRTDSMSLGVTYYADSISDPIQFPDKPSGYEFTAGYTHSLGAGLPWVSGTMGAYRFNTGTTFNGWRLTGDISSPCNMLTLKGEVGYDPYNGNFRSLSAMLTYFFSWGI